MAIDKMGGDEKRGKIIELGKRRAELGLPEVTEEMSSRSITEFAEKTIKRLAGKNLAPVSVSNYSDFELEKILFQELQNQGNSGENFTYAAAEEYLKRKKVRTIMQNPNN